MKKETRTTILRIGLIGLIGWSAMAQTKLYIQRDLNQDIFLDWESESPLLILQQSDDLVEGQFENLGNVMDENTRELTLTPSSETAFYRLRHVEEMSFSDQNLERAIRDNLAEKYGPSNGLYDIDIEDLEDLLADHSGIQGLDGFQDMNSLKNLWLQQNHLNDINALTSFNALEVLDIRGGFIHDLSPLSGITSLLSLKLGGNQISGFLPLQNLVKLQDLEAANTSITSLEGLQNLQGLTTLDLGANQISDLSPIAGLSNLQILILENNDLQDCNALQSLENLSELDLSHNQISDLTPLLQNSGINAGDLLRLDGNPLADESQVVTLRSRGVHVMYTP